MNKNSDLDICVCGDYRQNHENGVGKCLVCHYMPYPEGGCQHFVLAENANDERNLPIKPKVVNINTDEAKKLWQSADAMIKDPISVKCGNCGTYRMKRDSVIEKCPCCGDDEYEYGL